MKTKIIPFDLETARKIQAGKIKGRIIYNNSEAEILDFNLRFKGHTYICAKTMGNSGIYSTKLFDRYGKDAESCVYYNLILEVPDNEPQFKPFDRVLVRMTVNDTWHCDLFSHMNGDTYVCICDTFTFCIPYEGNEHLVGSTDKPKED